MPSTTTTQAAGQVTDPERTLKRDSAYAEEVDRTYTCMVPPHMRVLELGCGTGRLLRKLQPAVGVGIDCDPRSIEVANDLHADRSELNFSCSTIEQADWDQSEPFDYIILSDVVMYLEDLQETFSKLHSVCAPHTRLIINYPSNLWRPALRLASLLGLRKPETARNGFSSSDLDNLLNLADFEVITIKGRILLPLRIPVLGWLANRLLAKLPLVSSLCLTRYMVARPRPPHPAPHQDGYSVSVLIPTRDEKGNIEAAFKRTPQMGAWTELLFVDGDSSDGTVEEIERCIEKYGEHWKRVELIHQTGKGKGQAVRQGFAECKGDVFMILDSDLTMPPEDLPKFYHAIASGHGELINGSRLVYAMEKKAMRFLNTVANYFFACLFTYLLDQPVKDTLCGTKVLWRKDYLTIDANRSYFGDFDPFGDFDLLFGAARLNHKIVDLPVRYRERTYGDIKIDRWRHGLLLFQMSYIAFKQLKLRS